jgi:glycosyltransferase involved in cell wall biosynthesis
MSLVSVIIPIYNRLDYIGEAIESVLIQTYGDYEIIVVDDGSTLDVSSVVTPYMTKIKYVSQSHKGLSAARNTGIKNSNGEYLAFLDDDDLFEPRKLEVQMALLETNPDIGFVYSDCHEFDSQEKREPWLNLAVGRDQSRNEFSKLFFMNPNIRIPTVLFRRKCFEDVGLFDESLEQHEDGDMLLRTALRWEVQFSHYPSARVRQHGDRMSRNRAGMYQAIITSSQKILEEFPDFKRDLEGYSDRRMAALHYLLAHAYLENQMITKAREAFISCAQFRDPVKYRAYCYILLLSLGNTLGTMFARMIGVMRGLIN